MARARRRRGWVWLGALIAGFAAGGMVPQMGMAQTETPRAGDFAAVPDQPHFVELDGARIHYVERGRGEPILFMHGLPTWSYVWRDVLPWVEAPGRRLIAVDLVGFGRSTGNGYGVLAQVGHLERFVGALGLGRVTLVTQDWGAGVGLIWAADHPDRVRAFATMEGALPPVYPRPDLASFGPAAPLFTAMRDPQAGPATVQERNAWLATILPTMTLAPLPEPVMAAYLAPFPTPASRRSLLEMTRTLPVGGEPAGVVEAYARAAAWWRETAIPKLVIYASPGRLTRKEHVRWTVANVRNVETAFVGRGSHLLQEEQPEAVGRALADWYRRLSAKPRG